MRTFSIQPCNQGKTPGEFFVGDEFGNDASDYPLTWEEAERALAELQKENGKKKKLKAKKYPSGMVELAGILGESGAQFGANIRPMDTGEFSLSVSWGNEACYFHAFPRQKNIPSAKKAAENLYDALIAHLQTVGTFPRRDQVLPNHYPAT